MSSRARVRIAVGVVAVAVAAIAAAVAWSGRADEGAVDAVATGPREGAPPLELDALVADGALATALREAEDLYDDGNRAAAAAAFDDILADHPDSLEAAVGAAASTWPTGTTDRLAQLATEHPDSALVQLQLGLTLLWERRDSEADAAWREALAVEPDSSSAVRAESLLHPDMAPGRPFFVPSASFPDDLEGLSPLDQLDALERQAKEEQTAEAWLLYGTALQRAGRVVSALEAFDRAAELAPDDPEALTAAALGRFTKENPSAAFSRLGPLADRFPSSSVVRFHVGLGLLWLRNVAEARKQLELAATSEPGTVWAEQARLLLDELDRQGETGSTNP